MDTLLLGALAAVAFREAGQRALWSRLMRPVAAVSGSVFAAVAASTVLLDPSFSYYYTFGSGAIAAFYACLVSWAATSGSENLILCHKSLRVLGKYSYGIYVLHVIPLYYIGDGMSRATLGDRLLIIALSVATTAGLTYISWVALERPALSLKPYFEYARPGDAVAEDAPGPAVAGWVAGVGPGGREMTGPYYSNASRNPRVAPGSIGVRESPDRRGTKEKAVGPGGASPAAKRPAFDDPSWQRAVDAIIRRAE